MNGKYDLKKRLQSWAKCDGYDGNKSKLALQSKIYNKKRLKVLSLQGFRDFFSSEQPTIVTYAALSLIGGSYQNDQSSHAPQI